jgi:serine/threonine-protein kinase
MGVVLAARHTQLGQLVAIKLLQGKAAHETNAVERFLREARAAATLSSEHVARVHDIGTLETGEPYLVMEFLAGVDLGAVIRRDGPMPVPDAVDAVLQACGAVAEAHAAGIIHRDLKPSNLFRIQRSDGTSAIKVLDFGISKVTDPEQAGAAEPALTSTGMTMGSPQYMSPEQVRNAKDVDGRSDIWALGVVLYELLTGKSPFSAETLGATFANIVSLTPPRVERVRPGVPESLGTVIAACLDREREGRPPTIADLASKLAPFAPPPPDAARAVQRIARASGTPAPPAENAKRHDPAALEPTVPSPGQSPPAPAPVAETGPPWQTSGIGQEIPMRRPRAAALAAGTVGVLLAAVVGTYVLGTKPKHPELPAAASAASERAAVIAPAVTPTSSGVQAAGPDAGAASMDVAEVRAATSAAPPHPPTVAPEPTETRSPKAPRRAIPPAAGDTKPRARPHSAATGPTDNPLDHL